MEVGKKVIIKDQIQIDELVKEGIELENYVD